MVPVREKSNESAIWINEDAENQQALSLCGLRRQLRLRGLVGTPQDIRAAKEGDIRIVDESGDDYMFDAQRFVRVILPKALERAVLRKAS